jgi:hypothetical protein
MILHIVGFYRASLRLLLNWRYLKHHPDYNFSEFSREAGAENTHTSSESNIPLAEFDIQGFHALATSRVERRIH